MRKILCLTLLLMFLAPLVFADRNTTTTKAYTSDTLIKRGDWKIYHIDFIATANGGNFTIYDALTYGTDSDVKTEGSEATSLNGKPYNFSNKPLEGSTGLYLDITTANVVVEYE